MQGSAGTDEQATGEIGSFQQSIEDGVVVAFGDAVVVVVVVSEEGSMVGVVAAAVDVAVAGIIHTTRRCSNRSIFRERI